MFHNEHTGDCVVLTTVFVKSMINKIKIKTYLIFFIIVNKFFLNVM